MSPGLASTEMTRSSAPDAPDAITTSPSVNGDAPTAPGGGVTSIHAATALRAEGDPAECRYPTPAPDATLCDRADSRAGGGGRLPNADGSPRARERWVWGLPAGRTRDSTMARIGLRERRATAEAGSSATEGGGGWVGGWAGGWREAGRSESVNGAGGRRRVGGI